MTDAPSDSQGASPASQPPIDIPSVYPYEELNKRWLGYVHPGNWENPKPSGKYNMLVIGGGPAGLVVAAGAAGLGAKVALVEKHLLGGDCLNVGCVPSKALLRSARAAASVRYADALGVHVSGGFNVDFPAVMQRLRTLRADLSHHDSAERFSKLGVDVFIGQGQFTGPQSFEIEGHTIDFAKACIATGARAAAPPIPGLDQVPYLTNESIFSLTELPRRLGVIGAGPIGCEMAQAFARLGSDVHLIEAQHGILPREDRDAADVVKASLLRDGVQLKCCGKDLRVEPAEGGAVRLIVDAVDATKAGHERAPFDVTVDKLLIGVGRKANVENLGLEAAGVAYGSKGVQVDDSLRTTNRRIFAAGDVASKYQFTHAADAMARLVIRNALFFGRGKASKLVIPWCTYTQPELAQVGLSEPQAQEQGVDVDVFRIDLSSVDRAVLDGQTRGFLKVICAKGKGKILGATIVADHAGDLLPELVFAMTHGRTLGDIASTIHAYPTQAETIKKAADAYNRTRLTKLVARVFDLLLRWQR